MASIQSRRTSSGAVRWRVRYRHDGAQRVQTFASETAAKRWATLLDALGPGPAVDALAQEAVADVPTVAELLADHIDHLTGITEGTRSDYRRIAQRHIVPHLGAVPVTLIDRQAGARWVNTLAGSGLAGKTVRNVHSLLSAALTDAARDKVIGENPVKGLRLPATVASAEMVFLTWEEYQRLLALVPAQWQPLVGVLAESGMRWGEATALTVADVDLDRATLRIRQAWKRTTSARAELGTTKGRAARTISAPASWRGFLAEATTGRAPGDWLFVNGSGGPVRHSNFRLNVWVPAVAQFAGDELTGQRHPTSRRELWDGKGTGKRPRIHDLRHSFASWAIASGLSLTAIQRHMGHQSIKTTSDTYGHVFRADLDAFASVRPPSRPALEA